MSKSLDPTAFSKAQDGGWYDVDEAFNITCHICGEWLDFGPEITKGSDGEIISVVFTAGSCGEKFTIKPTGYILTFESEGLV